jgi:hypothetical protein
MEMKRDLMPKDMRQKIRAETVEELVRSLTEKYPDQPAERIRSHAAKLANLAISRERQKERAWLN